MSDLATSPSPIKFRWIPGLVVVLLLFVAIAVFSTRIAVRTATYDDGEAAKRYDTLAKLRAEDAKTLTTADWVDKAKGTVRIPIDEALPQAITQLKAKPVEMGAEIPGAAPAPAPAAAPSTNAAPASPTPPSTNAAPAAPAPPAAKK